MKPNHKLFPLRRGFLNLINEVFLYSIRPMKTAGLPSNYRTKQRKTTRTLAFASLHETYLATKAQQNAQYAKAAQAQFERQKKEKELLSKATPSTDNP